MPIFAATRVERTVLGTLTLLLTLALIFHAGIETLFVMPANPLGERLRALVVSYTHPYFEQYWNVFAPTPIESDIVVLARTRGANGTVARWVDLTQPLLDEVRANPISRYSTLKIIAMTLAVAALNDKELSKGKFTPAQSDALRNPRTRPMIVDGLLRLALFLRAGEGTHPADVQISIVRHQFPRFTHRFDRDDKRQHNEALTLPWLPVPAAAVAGAAS